MLQLSRDFELPRLVLEHPAWGSLGRLEAEEFQSRTTDFYLVGRGRKPLLVLGVLPPSLLSNSGYLWLVWLEKTTFSLGELKTLKKLFYQEAGIRNLRAEAGINNLVAQKFIKFFGFKKLHTFNDRIVYERAI